MYTYIIKHLEDILAGIRIWKCERLFKRISKKIRLNFDNYLIKFIVSYTFVNSSLLIRFFNCFNKEMRTNNKIFFFGSDLLIDTQCKKKHPNICESLLRHERNVQCKSCRVRNGHQTVTLILVPREVVFSNMNSIFIFELVIRENFVSDCINNSGE